MVKFHSFIIIIVIRFHVVLSVRKCCDSDSSIRKMNSTSFICDLTEDKRLQIFTNDTNSLKMTTATSDCFDINGQINWYNVKNSRIYNETKFDVNFFPKCCPLKYFYNTTTHSCIESTNDETVLDTSFITQHFIKVGLPHCKVIVDYQLNSRGDYKLELDSVHLDKHNKQYRYGHFCIDLDDKDGIVVRGCHHDLEICKGHLKCIHKCCPDGKSFINGSKCVDTYRYGADLSFSNRINDSEAPFALIHGYECNRIYLMREERYSFFLDGTGVFWAYYNFSRSFKNHEIDDKSYCIEHVLKKNEKESIDEYKFFMCFTETPVKAKFIISRWIKIISTVFLTLTIVVYLLLPEMRNLFGKILISYCTSMILSYTTLIYTQFNPNTSDILCAVMSFLSLFASLSTFTWLNVMCIDIWLAFGTPKLLVTMQVKKRETKKFWMYSLYAWTAPIILCLITFVCYRSDSIPYAIKPFIGMYKCYWERRPDNYAILLYLVAPLLIIKVTNLILFTKTIVYCLKVKTEINKMNDNRKSMKERKRNYSHSKKELILVLKLSVIMGISLTFEVISSIFDFSSNPVTEMIEVIWDNLNCLQGFLIFVIFVCKQNIYRLCHSKIVGDPNRENSLCLTNTMTTHTSLLRNSTT